MRARGCFSRGRSTGPIPLHRLMFETKARYKLPQSERQGEDRNFQQPNFAVAAEQIEENGLNDRYAGTEAGFYRLRERLLAEMP